MSLRRILVMWPQLQGACSDPTWFIQHQEIFEPQPRNFGWMDRTHHFLYYLLQMGRRAFLTYYCRWSLNLVHVNCSSWSFTNITVMLWLVSNTTYNWQKWFSVGCCFCHSHGKCLKKVTVCLLSSNFCISVNSLVPVTCNSWLLSQS